MRRRNSWREACPLFGHLHKAYDHTTNRKPARHCHPSTEPDPSPINWNQTRYRDSYRGAHGLRAAQICAKWCNLIRGWGSPSRRMHRPTRWGKARRSRARTRLGLTASGSHRFTARETPTRTSLLTMPPRAMPSTGRKPSSTSAVSGSGWQRVLLVNDSQDRNDSAWQGCLTTLASPTPRPGCRRYNLPRKGD
jgi:hypothetical protein